jgi:tetratricopeptide (TPR) repeat protein
VNAQLIDAGTDAHRWAQDYRRELTPENVFDLQGEIAGEIATSLEAELSPQERERVERRPTHDLTAYQLYVQGRRELARRAAGDMERAVRLFRQAIERDSSFALAWAGLADAAGHDLWGFEGYDTLAVTPEEAARRALELDPDLAEAHASVGLVHYRNRDGPDALAALHRAVELKPSYAEAHSWLSHTYLQLGRREPALRHLELARELNPQHYGVRRRLNFAHINEEQLDQALQEIRELQRRFGSEHGLVAEIQVLYALGRYEEAAAATEDEERFAASGHGRAYLAAIETAMGDTARARERLAELEKTEAPPIVLAYAYAAIGDVDRTLAAFERVENWDSIATGTLRYGIFPEGMKRIRNDPRYEALIREVNEYWGLNPDGSLPEGVDVSLSSEPDG